MQSVLGVHHVLSWNSSHPPSFTDPHRADLLGGRSQPHECQTRHGSWSIPAPTCGTCPPHMASPHTSSSWFFLPRGEQAFGIPSPAASAHARYRATGFELRKLAIMLSAPAPRAGLGTPRPVSGPSRPSPCCASAFKHSSTSAGRDRPVSYASKSKSKVEGEDTTPSSLARDAPMPDIDRPFLLPSLAPLPLLPLSSSSFRSGRGT
ncbi:hypothetical protein L227DRAFT_251645 [Lentinus tigrinus ALCF2SS1-6]|uniref:Uncharacterized protein n=1 Tax=Lentinus tigrinus ALCF2SS1-6 TaxID=1328759 RepID=A0A5C2S051_9APHY|nr:hypothetical protein L227DRAFT_251645 [Lentinus tigrinus ALCF2SS1-6]